MDDRQNLSAGMARQVDDSGEDWGDVTSPQRDEHEYLSPHQHRDALSDDICGW